MSGMRRRLRRPLRGRTGAGMLCTARRRLHPGIEGKLFVLPGCGRGLAARRPRHGRRCRAGCGPRRRHGSRGGRRREGGWARGAAHRPVVTVRDPVVQVAPSATGCSMHAIRIGHMRRAMREGCRRHGMPHRLVVPAGNPLVQGQGRQHLVQLVGPMGYRLRGQVGPVRACARRAGIPAEHRRSLARRGGMSPQIVTGPLRRPQAGQRTVPLEHRPTPGRPRLGAMAIRGLRTRKIRRPAGAGSAQVSVVR